MVRLCAEGVPTMVGIAHPEVCTMVGIVHPEVHPVGMRGMPGTLPWVWEACLVHTRVWEEVHPVYTPTRVWEEVYHPGYVLPYTTLGIPRSYGAPRSCTLLHAGLTVVWQRGPGL